jgi:hypothetical protein
MTKIEELKNTLAHACAHWRRKKMFFAGRSGRVGLREIHAEQSRIKQNKVEQSEIQAGSNQIKVNQG